MMNFKNEKPEETAGVDPSMIERLQEVVNFDPSMIGKPLETVSFDPSMIGEPQDAVSFDQPLCERKEKLLDSKSTNPIERALFSQGEVIPIIKVERAGDLEERGKAFIKDNLEALRDIANSEGGLDAFVKCMRSLTDANPVEKIDVVEEKGKYIFKNGKLRKLAINGQCTVPICNFQIEIERETVKIGRSRGSGDPERRSFYEGRISTPIMVKTFKISAIQFLQEKWYIGVTDGKAYLETGAGENFKKYLQTLVDENHPMAVEYEVNGWNMVDGLGWRYVVDFGIIGQGETYITGNKNQKLLCDFTKMNGREDYVAVWDMLKITKDVKKTLPLLLFTHLGVLSTLFELAEFPIHFVLGFFGVTNSKKTSISLVMTKLFNRDNLRKPEVSFFSTDCGIEEQWSLSPDSVFLLDDKRPCESRTAQNEQNAKYEKVVRAYGDGIDKKRMTAYSKGVEAYFPPRGVCLVTGEVDGGVQSTRSRVLVVEMDAEQCDDAVLLHYQKNPCIFSNYFYNFILFATGNFDEIVTHIKVGVPEWRKEYGRIFQIPRYAEAAADFRVMLEIINRYASYLQFDNAYMQDFVEKSMREMIAVLHENDAKISDHNPGEMFVQAFGWALQNNNYKRVVCQDKEKVGIGQGDCIYETQDFLFLKLDLAFRICLKYWGGLNVHFPLELPAQLPPFLRTMRLLKTDAERNTIKLTKYINSQTRFLVLKKEVLEELQNKNT